jgi:hypothetical protein
MRKNPTRSSVKFGNSLGSEIGGSEGGERLKLSRWICWTGDRSKIAHGFDATLLSIVLFSFQFQALLRKLALATVRAPIINYE